MVRALARCFGEILLAFVLCAGLFCVASMLAPISTNLTASGQDLFAWRIVFDRKGVPRLEHRQSLSSHKRRQRIVTWYDLDGNEIGEYPEHKAPRSRLGHMADFTEVLEPSWRGGRRADLTGWRYLPVPGMEAPIWHELPYVGLFVGYLYPYGRLLGYLGPEGQIDPNEPHARFSDPRYIATAPILGNIWVDGKRLYAIDLDRQTVLTLWESPAEPIRALGWVRNMGIILCGNTLRVIDVKLKTHLKAELPPDLRKNVIWQTAWIDDKLVICNLAPAHCVVYHIATDGSILDRWKVDVPSSKGLSRSRKVTLTVAASIMPPWVGMLIDKLLEQRFPNVHRMIGSWLRWPYRADYFAISLGVTLLAAVLTWWHLRLRSTRFDMGLGIGMALLFSMPGYVVARSLFLVSERLACSSCGRLRPTDWDRCPHCGAPWPAPAQTGTEILLSPAEAKPRDV